MTHHPNPARVDAVMTPEAERVGNPIVFRMGARWAAELGVALTEEQWTAVERDIEAAIRAARAVALEEVQKKLSSILLEDDGTPLTAGARNGVTQALIAVRALVQPATACSHAFVQRVHWCCEHCGAEMRSDAP